ncbi:unnamed protein product [Zymoseptoria tritici ST99CH_1A5]|uniref:HbrB-like protein n=1 Tax=Zymoseptoria tritici ST99CH_1A5 TaxID=1276529 RepID=A0A1Y6L5N4_ZYMTR|nr:unnamed protein product [Zymoseptoria tritici ST99CH_1A5]
MNDNLPLRPPPRPRSPSGNRSQSSISQVSLRSGSSASLASPESPPMMPPPSFKRSPYMQQLQPPTRPSTAGGPSPSQSTTALHGNPRHINRTSTDGVNVSPNLAQQQWGHRARQHSQGFFEPSLASANNNVPNASTIAAQAAMHHISPPMLSAERKRSYPGLVPINTGQPGSRRPSDNTSPQLTQNGLSYSNGTVGGNRLAATTAANVAFPPVRSPLPSPGFPPPSTGGHSPVLPADKEVKSKSSKMKLFKPKNIVLSKEKDPKSTGFPSPGKGPVPAAFLRGGFANASTTSLVDPGSSANSIYSSANVSTSTLVPTAAEKDREKRHHFLSRQKNKLKDEPTQLPLSSAHSNSQATNPDKPQPLYSFTPDSAGPSAFAKSMSGFDLRHGGRALREKKKEEKAAAAAAKLDLTPIISNGSATTADHYLGPSSFETSMTGPPTGGASLFSVPTTSDAPLPVTAQAFSNIGAQMGLPGIGPDDAWPLLKARLLNLFSGENLRTPIEDFNALVSVHVRRCVQRRSPVVLVEDVRELLQTGFGSLAQTLRGVPDDRLVTNLVEMWIGVYGAILPFLQAVFLPLELEFKGRGPLMTAREAQEFWGAIPEALKLDERPESAEGHRAMPHQTEELEIRRITLIAFRDTVIIPKHETLLNIFSRLSLDSINANVSPDPARARDHARSDPTAPGADRPSTAGSLSPRLSSFNSQGSTLLDAASSSSGGGGGTSALANRSRATSNTSAGSFGTSLPHLHSPALPGGGPGSFATSVGGAFPTMSSSATNGAKDPAKVTDTVARMLQCLYVLASCRTGDVAQANVERLTAKLKYNWLGRGRTGRDRRGWVGMKAGKRVGLVGAG